VTVIIADIFDLFARFGSERYGEDLSLERHMLQSAALAQSMGAPRSVVAAALLHDIGYFLQEGGEARGNGDLLAEHEVAGAAWLSRAFDESVTAPIALHVEAKRYLCAVEPDYFGKLSNASRQSLVLQGGVMSKDEVKAFEKEPAFEAALTLRRCDDLGKNASLQTLTIEHFRGLLEASLRPTI
jgi:phosphonate degradation associated HDIG domain protein